MAVLLRRAGPTPTRRRRRAGRAGPATAMAVALGFLAAACGGGPSPQPDSTPGSLPSAPTTAIPSANGPAYATDAALTIGLAGEPTNWNPLAAPAPTDPALAAVVDAVLPSAAVGGGLPSAAVGGGLPSAAGAVLPSAAVAGTDSSTDPGSDLVIAATEISADPQTVVYELNPRATWSDGVAITAADFAYTWEAQSGQDRFRDREGRSFTPASTAGYRTISSVTSPAGDPDRVVVRFATPYPDWEALFDPILPAHVARRVGFDHGFTDPVTSLVSGGPFLVQSYHPGADVVLVRNPRWWGQTANLSAIDVDFVGSAPEAAVSLEEGQLDAAVSAFTPATVAALRATAGLTVSVTAGTDFDDLVFDERSGPLAVRAVRLAIIEAVDRRSLARQAVAAGDTSATAVTNRAFPPGAAGYRDDAGVLAGSGAAAPTQAGALLAAAGYVTRGSTLEHGGRPVRLRLAVETTSPLAAIEVAAIVGACRSLGMTVTISARPARGRIPPLGALALVEAPLLTAATAVETYGAGVASGASGAGVASGSGVASGASGAAAGPSGYASPVMEGLLQRLATAGSTSERDEILDGVDAQAWNDAVDLPLLGVPRVLTFESRYANLGPAPSASGISAAPAQWGIPLPS